VFVAVFAVAGWVRVWIVLFVPRDERFTEFLENSVTGLRMQVRIAVVLLQIRTEFIGIWYVTDSVPDTRDCPPPNIPEFAGGEAMRIKIVRDLRVIGETRCECPSDGLIRHT
jgi:hypothetical protein